MALADSPGAFLTARAIHDCLRGNPRNTTPTLKPYSSGLPELEHLDNGGMKLARRENSHCHNGMRKKGNLLRAHCLMEFPLIEKPLVLMLSCGPNSCLTRLLSGVVRSSMRKQPTASLVGSHLTMIEVDFGRRELPRQP
ncbi:protein of unknown function [Magnetospirillum sp. XM-1]|nr:protein of unknown function [Magnetospirillum sp. XM-1]